MNIIFPKDPPFPWPWPKKSPIPGRPDKKDNDEKIAKILKKLADIIFSGKKK